MSAVEGIVDGWISGPPPRLTSDAPWSTGPSPLSKTSSPIPQLALFKRRKLSRIVVVPISPTSMIGSGGNLFVDSEPRNRFYKCTSILTAHLALPHNPARENVISRFVVREKEAIKTSKEKYHTAYGAFNLVPDSPRCWSPLSRIRRG